MREAYLVNNSQSVTSIPLYKKSPVVLHGRTLQRLNFKKLVPSEEFVLGINISSDERKYYGQFKAIMVDLKFRNVPEIVVEETPSEEGKTDEDSGVNADEVKVQSEIYTEESLMKMRQAELIAIAVGLGCEATTQNSKAEITKMILENQPVG